MTRRALLRLAVAPLALPHELAHALPAAVAGLPVDVTLLPEWEGSRQPLGRFDTTPTPTTPLWLVSAIAIAPVPVYVALAVAVRLLVHPTGPAAIAAMVCCSIWASPSNGDVAVARHPAEARAAGEFLVTTTGSETAVADVATVAVTLLVGVIVLG